MIVYCSPLEYVDTIYDVARGEISTKQQSKCCVRTKYQESGISKYGWKQARTGALHLTKVGNVETSSHRGMAIARTQMEQMDLKQFERNEIKCFRRVARNKEIT